MPTNLNTKQQLAAQLLATGKRATEVAATLCVRKETLTRWKHLPEFRAAINALLQENRDVARTRLISLMGKAFDALEDDLQARSDPIRRARAAFKVLDLTMTSLPTSPLPTDKNTVKAADLDEKLRSMFD